MHPFTRIVIVFCITTGSLLYLSLPVQTILLAASVLLVMSRKRDVLHSRKLKRNLQGLISIILSIFVLQTLFIHTGQVIFHLGWFHINMGGVETALEVSLRLIILVLLAAWLIGLSLKDYLDAFYIVRMPETLAVMTAMTIRFIPVLAEQISDEREQIMLRGINLKKLGMRKRLEIYRSLIMPVLGKTMQDVKYQAIALDLRGFRNGRKHSRFQPSGLSIMDVAVILVVVSLSVVPAFL